VASRPLDASEDDDSMTEFPLTKINRIRLARAFAPVPRVDLSIEGVIEGQFGRAFVDDPGQPEAFMIRVGPFAYLAGAPGGPGARALLEALEPDTLLMPSGAGWIDAAKAAFGPRLSRFERFRFCGERLDAAHLERLAGASRYAAGVHRMDLEFAARFHGREHFVDLAAYDSPEDFIERGAGFYLERNGKLAAAAYASLACSRGIEVSLYVIEKYRRMGIATLLASRLLSWSLAHHAPANWDAANPASCRIAEKLGYVASGTYEAYALSGAQ
jgi:GNAT superfamily N-acetyltransferase